MDETSGTTFEISRRFLLMWSFFGFIALSRMRSLAARKRRDRHGTEACSSGRELLLCEVHEAHQSHGRWHLLGVCQPRIVTSFDDRLTHRFPKEAHDIHLRRENTTSLPASKLVTQHRWGHCPS